MLLIPNRAKGHFPSFSVMNKREPLASVRSLPTTPEPPLNKLLTTNATTVHASDNNVYYLLKLYSALGIYVIANLHRKSVKLALLASG